jgi:hypothetical protein
MLTLTPGKNHVDMRYHRHSNTRLVMQIQGRTTNVDRHILRGYSHSRLPLSDPDSHLVA